MRESLIDETIQMPITFNNSPIIELIAEVRWDIVHQPLPGAQIPGGPRGVVTNPAVHEHFFTQFSGHVFQLGFQQQERLVPQGFPLFANQPVFRFRSTRKPQVLYQIGAGFFSANATAPYKTWKDFAPIIEDGIKTLLQVRNDDEKDTSFSSVSLRYLDAFMPPLTQSLDIASFISDILGIKLTLPDGISKNLDAGKTYKPSLQLQIPIKNETTMHLAIGEGIANNKPAFVMDTNILTNTLLAPTVESVMNSMNSAHDVIHDMFFAITAPIYDLMDPVGEA